MSKTADIRALLQKKSDTLEGIAACYEGIERGRAKVARIDKQLDELRNAATGKEGE